MLNSMRCKHCGLTQLAASVCEACGKSTGITTSPRRSPAAPQPVSAARQPADIPQTVTRSSLSSVVDAGTDNGDTVGSVGDHPASLRETDERQSVDSTTRSGDTHRLIFLGRPGSLFGIHTVNAFLTVLTLGLYSFWGKVRVRAYLLSQTDFEGDRFAYHGTGRELFVGALKAGLLFGTCSALIQWAPRAGLSDPVKVLVFVLAYVGLFALIPIAIVGARRYRLSRMSWRNIRFSFHGRIRDLAKLFLLSAILWPLTLGLYAPFFATAKHAFLVSHSRFGNRTFAFDGQGKDLFGPYLVALLLTLPTMGLSWLWYIARQKRYFWSKTTFGSTRFTSTITGRGLFGLYAGNLVLLVLTLGLAWPWVEIRNIRFNFENVAIVGDLDLDDIQQDAQVATATGDALDQFLDMDTGLAA